MYIHLPRFRNFIWRCQAIWRFEVWGLETLSARNGPDDGKGFCTRRDGVGQRGVRRLVGKIFLARKESQERPALLCDMIADGPAQHGIAGLECVKHRALRDRPLDLKLQLIADIRQRSQMLRECNSNHGSVSTPTDNTAGISPTIGAPLSPPSPVALTCP